jgi:hypothetical protein
VLTAWSRAAAGGVKPIGLRPPPHRWRGGIFATFSVSPHTPAPPTKLTQRLSCRIQFGIFKLRLGIAQTYHLSILQMKSCRAFTAPGGERFTRLRAPVLPLHLQGVANTDHANLVKGVHMLRSFPRPTAFGALIALLLAASAPAATWVEFANQTATRLVADPSVGTADAEEKDYAWGDVDKDGDIDIVCVRKQPFTTPGRRANVLFMNEGTAEGHAIDGVFVDRTAQYATDADDGGQGFLDLTNDRDVILADVDGDTWLDIITVATISDGLPKTISHPRIYRNKGEIAGVWQGFRYEQARIPQLRTIPGNVAVAPRFCSVVAGDVTGDGAVDLYFGDYDSGGVGGATPEDPADDVNDRLLINTGTGFFVDSLENRMTGEMLLSAFSMAAAIEDMNGDGVLDVVKDSALNAPQRVSVSYNDPANEGFFDELDVVYNDAPYHISVGDLNNDNRLDIVITDDGQDAYLLNQGNGADGLADFLTYPFLRSSGGDAEFGGNSVIADLNQDSFNDVLIADVDVDSPGCSRRLHLYRNLGDTPEVTLQEQGGAEPWTPNGVHDVAVFDINNDGYPDMFVGTCTTTQVWINVPPPDLVFTYPDGLPGTLAPGVSATFRVSVSGTGSTPQPGTGQQYVSVDGGPFTQTAMVEESPNVYFVNLPAVACTSTVRFLRLGGDRHRHHRQRPHRCADRHVLGPGFAGDAGGVRGCVRDRRTGMDGDQRTGPRLGRVGTRRSDRHVLPHRQQHVRPAGGRFRRRG